MSEKKREFNKQRWREMTYSHKAKVAKWTVSNGKSIKARYFRMKKRVHQESEEAVVDDRSGEPNEQNQRKSQRKSFKQAKLEFEMRQKKAEKKQKKDEKKQKYLEKKAKLEEYKKRKAEKFKVLSKKNKRGQPLMAGRMEMLYERIKNSS